VDQEASLEDLLALDLPDQEASLEVHQVLAVAQDQEASLEDHRSHQVLAVDRSPNTPIIATVARVQATVDQEPHLDLPDLEAVAIPVPVCHIQDQVQARQSLQDQVQARQSLQDQVQARQNLQDQVITRILVAPLCHVMTLIPLYLRKNPFQPFPTVLRRLLRMRALGLVP